MVYLKALSKGKKYREGKQSDIWCVCVSYPKRAASSATPEEGIFSLFVFVFALSVLKQKKKEPIRSQNSTRTIHTMSLHVWVCH